MTCQCWVQRGLGGSGYCGLSGDQAYSVQRNRSDRGGRGVAESSSEESFEAAEARLERAFARLDASVRSLNGRMRAHSRIEADTARLVSERSRFAAELDKASARAKRLDDSAGEVARRLVIAMETVREVLAK